MGDMNGLKVSLVSWSHTGQREQLTANSVLTFRRASQQSWMCLAREVKAGSLVVGVERNLGCDRG